MTEQHYSTDVYGSAAIDGMLRAELGAVGTYNLAIEYLNCSEFVAELERFRDEHQEAVGVLRLWARDLHSNTSSTPDAWACFAPVGAGDAQGLAEDDVLAVLRRGERQGEVAYRHELGNPDLPDEVRHFVGAKLLPRCQQRLVRLERYASR